MSQADDASRGQGDPRLDDHSGITMRSMEGNGEFFKELDLSAAFYRTRRVPDLASHVQRPRLVSGLPLLEDVDTVEMRGSRCSI